MSAGSEAPLRLALSIPEAAAALGVSREHFDRHVLAQLAVLRVGRRKLIAVAELERYLAAKADPPAVLALRGRAPRTERRARLDTGPTRGPRRAQAPEAAGPLGSAGGGG